MPACHRWSLQIALLMLVLVLSACGNKGDLIKPSSTPVARPDATAPAIVPAPPPAATTNDGAAY